MALFTTLAALSQTAGANPPDGSADAPSTIPTDLRLLGSFDAIMRDGGHQWGATVGGTANAIAITVGGISALVAGQTFRFVAAADNTGAATLNVNSLGAKNVNKKGTVALAAGDIANLSTVTVVYDGVNFQLASAAQPAAMIVDRAYSEYTTNADLTAVIPYDDTVPQSTEGTQIMSVTITPKSATSRLRIQAKAFGSPLSSGDAIVLAAFTTASSSALAAAIGPANVNAGAVTNCCLDFEFVPGSTSAQTVSIRCGGTVGTVRLNGNTGARRLGGAARATLIVEEIAV